MVLDGLETWRGWKYPCFLSSFCSASPYCCFAVGIWVTEELMMSDGSQRLRNTGRLKISLFSSSPSNLFFFIACSLPESRSQGGGVFSWLDDEWCSLTIREHSNSWKYLHVPPLLQLCYPHCFVAVGVSSWEGGLGGSSWLDDDEWWFLTVREHWRVKNIIFSSSPSALFFFIPCSLQESGSRGGGRGSSS